MSSLSTAFVEEIPTPSTSSLRPVLAQHAIDLANERLAEAEPQAIIEWAIQHVPGLYQTTAFGLTGLAATDMISKISQRSAQPGLPPQHLVPLIFIDTLYHFPETLALADQVSRKYGVKLHVYTPPKASTVQEFEAEYGTELWTKDEDSYDYLVKVEPAQRAYAELNVGAVFTGRRRSQGGDRSYLRIVEVDSTGLLKINPLANWSFQQTKNYIDENHVPYNTLLDQGYKSVGDWHSTKASNGAIAKDSGLDAGERAGRWAGGAKTECGLHKDYFKMKAAFAKKQREAALLEKDAAKDKEPTSA